MNIQLGDFQQAEYTIPTRAIQKTPEHYQYTSQPLIHTRVTTTSEPLFYVYGYVWVFSLILQFICSWTSSRSSLFRMHSSPICSKTALPLSLGICAETWRKWRSESWGNLGEQHIQRPWGGSVLGLFEEQCYQSSVTRGRVAGDEAREVVGSLPCRPLKVIVRAWLNFEWEGMWSEGSEPHIPPSAVWGLYRRAGGRKQKDQIRALPML